MPQFPQQGRPVSQRGVRRHGFVHSIQQVTLTAGALAIALSAPAVTVSTITNQTATTDPQTITLSATPVVLFLPPMVLAGGNQTIVLTPPAVTVGIGAMVLPAGDQVLMLSPPSVTVTGTAVSVAVPYGRPVGQRGIRRWTPPSPSTSPETVFNQTLAVASAVIALEPPTQVRLASVTLATSQQTVTLSAPLATVAAPPSPGVQAEPITLQRRVVLRGRKTPRKSFLAQYGAIDALAPETLIATTSQQTVTLSAPTAVRLAGGVSLPASAAVITLSPQTMSVTGGAGFLSTGALSLALSAPEVTSQVSAVTVTVAPAIVTLSAPDVLAHRVVTLTPAIVTLSAQAVVANQGAVRSSGLQAVAVSAPPVTVAVSAMTLSAGTQAVAVSAPSVLRQAHITVGLPSNAVAVSAPAVSVTVSGTTVVLTPAVVTLRAVPPTVLGATSLPTDTFVGTLESRLPEQTLASRHPVYRLRFSG